MLGLVMNKAGQDLAISQKLAGGLRINGQAPSELEAESQATAVGKPENSQGPEAVETEAKEISARFADTLWGVLMNGADVTDDGIRHSRERGNPSS